MSKFVTLGACLFLSVALTSTLITSAHATEGALQHYPIGANTAQPAVMPPPGATSWLNYDQYYTANKFKNAQGNSSVPGFRLSAFGEAARMIHTWNFDLDGWHFSSQLIATILYTNASRGGTGHTAAGFGDLNTVPLYVWKDFGDFNFLAGFNVWAPTGNFSRSQALNTSLNYWTYAPEFALTYHPNDRFMANIDTVIMFNTENTATHYRSGSAINFDFQAGYRPFDAFKFVQLGFSGYYFAQFTDDISNGVSVAGGGNRGRVLGIGPQARFDFPGGGIIFKWQKEFFAMNRPEGNRFWCQFALKL